MFGDCVVVSRNRRVSDRNHTILCVAYFLDLFGRAGKIFIIIFCRSALHLLAAHSRNLNGVDVLKLLTHEVAFPNQIRR